MKPIIDIAIPVLNEEKTLREKILELHKYLKTNLDDFSWNIIISDNGSTDKTTEIGTELAESFPEIKFIKVPVKGVGAALKYAWKQSNADYIACMDLDLSTDIKHITDSVHILSEDNVDLVYASRLHKNSTVIGRSIKREITSRAFNFIIRKYLKTNISDSMCGFIFLKRSIFSILSDYGVQNDRWFFQAELLIVSSWLKLNIVELPVKWTDDSDSKVNVGSLALEYLRAMRKLKQNFHQIQYVNA